MRFKFARKLKHTTLASLIAFSSLSSDASVRQSSEIRNLADESIDYPYALMLGDIVNLDVLEPPAREIVMDKIQPRAFIWNHASRKLEVVDYPIERCEIVVYEDKEEIKYTATLSQDILNYLDNLFTEKNENGEFLYENFPSKGWHVLMKDEDRDNSMDYVNLQIPTNVLNLLEKEYKRRVDQLDNNGQQNNSGNQIRKNNR